VLDHISKAEVLELPIEVFKGKITVVDNLKTAKQAVEELLKETCIGFDSETRPSFRKGRKYPVALIQLATMNHCYLFRLNRIGFPDSLIQLLGNEKVCKVGLSLKDDFNVVRRRKPDFQPQNFVDLQTIVPQIGLKEAGLQKIYAILFGKKIAKNQRLSNWESQKLTDAQQMYAAIDAWACLRIYNKLKTELQVQE
jgi:ribonuclease D